MRNIACGFVVGLLLVTSGGHAASNDAQKYHQYCNSRFGFCVDYPADLTVDSPPTNNDGRRFYDRRGFVMIASGINNVLDDTLESEMAGRSESFDKVTYRTKGKDWFVLSGYKGAMILYIKSYVGKGSVHSLYVEYPASLKAEYSDIVTRVSRSFKKGDIDEIG